MNRITLDEALAMGRADARELHRQYGNAALVQLMGLVGFDRVYTRAEGCLLWDEHGQEYLDFTAHFGALNLGHNPPEVLDAVRRVEERPNLLQTGLSPLTAALAQNLALLTPGELSHTFFCNSGAEAVEAALKLARIATGRKRFVYCRNAFHGKTFGALSVTGRAAYQEPFEPLLPDRTAVPFGDAAALEEALAPRDAAAFIIEPIQGEGGVILAPSGYLKTAEELCRRTGTLLIVDEVQTGLGRTGTLFACEAEDVRPDLLCLSKSLGGGVEPIGATVATERVWQKGFGSLERSRIHTSTFGGNSRAAAAALAALDIIVREDLHQRAAELGAYLLARLGALRDRHPETVRAVRGRGLLIGLEFQEPQGWVNRLSFGGAARLSQEYLASLVAGELLRRHHVMTVFTLNNPNVLRLEPPLIVTREQIDHVVDALDDVLSGARSSLGLAVRSARAALSGMWGRREADGPHEPSA
ncbi:aspartate aminotransferase family protein [Limnochorda pilosa]|uniref:Putrescine--2-oxoglutarate aminotransferase n=1 Tax=Limnochorda pilosa TaxID=1555112 RepID=A0A0K2SKI8_LIMPI|nr:aminotransferase class III-fold pyridoxal phosphate-dependent enzyme [Limnochorda pilosa]BAS27610.1 putrescine--2-oxoglutarate aminotransferase [Limnochorda pilosa]